MIDVKTLNSMANINDIMDKFFEKYDIINKMRDKYGDISKDEIMKSARTPYILEQLKEFINQHYEFDNDLIDDYLSKINSPKLDATTVKVCLKYIANDCLSNNYDVETFLANYKEYKTSMIELVGYFIVDFLEADIKESTDKSEQKSRYKSSKIVAKKKVGLSLNDVYTREVYCELTENDMELMAEDILRYESLNDNEDKFDILFTVDKKPVYWLKGRFVDGKAQKDIVDIRDISEIVLMYFKVIK